MPRSMWTGSLSFGLVNVPVMVVTATRDQRIRFRQLHKDSNRPIEVKRFCSAEDVEVSWEETAHGYELDDKKIVVITDDDLASVEPRKTRTVEIESFVPLDDVDPMFFNHPYVLLPIGDSEGTLRAYQLLVEVMAKTDRAALGRFVMRTKEYLVLVRAREGRLQLETLLWSDEVRDPSDIAPDVRANKQAVETACALIEELSVDWEPERYEDRYRMRLEEVIEAKRKGGTVKAPTPEKEPVATPDLMAALEESLAKMKGERLEDLPKKELLEKAADAGVEGRSKMSKEELVEALDS
ncbi:MAG: end-binding protein Ku [Solirubrobacteraceae bacterium]|nr:end-binding protein Ku [Solirubrobacteraceae bacterium]